MMMASLVYADAGLCALKIQYMNKMYAYIDTVGAVTDDDNVASSV